MLFVFILQVKSLKFATEAAITILRIDDLIKLEPEKGEEKSYQQAYQSGQLNGWRRHPLYVNTLIRSVASLIQTFTLIIVSFFL